MRWEEIENAWYYRQNMRENKKGFSDDMFVITIYDKLIAFVSSDKTLKGVLVNCKGENRLLKIYLADKELEDVDLSGEDLTEGNFNFSKMRGANFQGANLAGAGFYQTDLTMADFKFANLSGASFNGTILEGALFEGANLEGTSFDRVDLSRSSLHGKQLSVAKLDDETVILSSSQRQEWQDVEKAEKPGVEISVGKTATSAIPYQAYDDGDECLIVVFGDMIVLGPNYCEGEIPLQIFDGHEWLSVDQESGGELVDIFDEASGNLEAWLPVTKIPKAIKEKILECNPDFSFAFEGIEDEE